MGERPEGYRNPIGKATGGCISTASWAVWRTVASPRHVRIVLYNSCSCCYSMLRKRGHVDRRPFPPAPCRRGPLAALPENDRPSMVSAFLEVLHHALPLGLCAVNGRGYPEQGLVGLPIVLIIHNWHSALMTPPEAAHFGGAKKPVKERPLVPPLIDDRPMLKTITSRLYPLRLPIRIRVHRRCTCSRRRILFHALISRWQRGQ